MKVDMIGRCWLITVRRRPEQAEFLLIGETEMLTELRNELMNAAKERINVGNRTLDDLPLREFRGDGVAQAAR